MSVFAPDRQEGNKNITFCNKKKTIKTMKKQTKIPTYYVQYITNYLLTFTINKNHT